MTGDSRASQRRLTAILELSGLATRLRLEAQRAISAGWRGDTTVFLEAQRRAEAHEITVVAAGT